MDRGDRGRAGRTEGIEGGQGGQRGLREGGQGGLREGRQREGRYGSGVMQYIWMCVCVRREGGREIHIWDGNYLYVDVYHILRHTSLLTGSGSLQIR